MVVIEDLEMTSSWIIWVGHKPKDTRLHQTQIRSTHGQGRGRVKTGRGWTTQAQATSPGARRGRKDPPLEPWEGGDPGTLDLDLRPAECESMLLLFPAVWFVILCYGGHRKLTRYGSIDLCLYVTKYINTSGERQRERERK